MSIKKRIIFLGDSITDAERNYLAKDGSLDQLGNGFVKTFQSGLKVKYYDRYYEVLNRGISGNRTTDLLERLKSDVIDYKPDYVYIMIGINDVWRHFDSPFRNIEQVSHEDYEKNYERIIKQCLDINATVILSSCYFLETDQSDAMRIMVNEFNEISYKLSQKYHLKYIDIQGMMDEFLKYNSSYAISSDRVHLNHVGAHLIADAYLKEFE